jgi:uncharacterized phiE125 gp8 family phage protein
MEKNMRIQQITPPAIEPVSLAALKLQLRYDGGTFAEQVNTTQSIAPGAHEVAEALEGAGVEVLGYDAVVNLNSGTNGTDGTVDVKIQESDDDTTYTDWAAFTQVTEENDNAIQEKAYTGSKRYIRVVAEIAVAACDFGVDIIRLAPTSVEDDLLNDIITTARREAEDYTGRAFITQTWDYFLDSFPPGNFFKLPFGNLQSVTYVKYRDSAGDEAIMTEDTDYLVETNGNQCGKIALPYDTSWPSFTPYPSKPVVVRYVCGYGTERSDVPMPIRTAIKMICADLYSMRGEPVIGKSVIKNDRAQRLLWNYILWDNFS